MRVLVTGAGGMLAHDLVPELRRRGHQVLAMTRAELDVTDRSAVEACFADARPDAAVHCAAYTDVDGAEADEAAAHLVNADATRYIAAACHKAGAKLVYPSTDYVFAGDAERPYSPADLTAPLNAYGRTKRAGELAALEAPGALVVRTSWLYGSGGGNFVSTMLRLARERRRIRVVDDQVGRPTWTGSLAAVLCGLLERNAGGIFHATDGGAPTSWYGFARRIMNGCCPEVRLEPVASAEFPRAAARPAYSVLDCVATEALLRAPLADWGSALKQYLDGHTGNKA